MDINSSNASPVLADSTPLTQSRLGIPLNLIPVPSATSSSTPGFSSSRFFTLNRKKPKPTKLDDVRASGWLDAMKASSPTHRNLDKDAATDCSDATYHSWMVRLLIELIQSTNICRSEADCQIYAAYLEMPQPIFFFGQLMHPSALRSFEHIAKSANGKTVALFLDYDGTLSPIVDDPDCAFMSDLMRSVVRSIAKHFPTAIISGRCRDKVYGFVRLEGLYYAGSHGMDIMGPKRASAPSDRSPICDTLTDTDVFETLRECTKGIRGVKVENNKFCVSVHYRCANEEDLICTIATAELTAGLADCSNVFPIYIGDDRTDEDAFMVLREKAEGYGILVSSVPKHTSAHYSLRDPSESRLRPRPLPRLNALRDLCLTIEAFSVTAIADRDMHSATRICFSTAHSCEAFTSVDTPRKDGIHTGLVKQIFHGIRISRTVSFHDTGRTPDHGRT
ncbi:hypothetical protein ACLOJK_003169 [Asimina triloba]